MPKELSVGIQSIEEIINKGFIYVDKTHFVEPLLKKGKYYFMARPRRFGKTLFITTLEEILRGNKELFKDCSIYTSNYDWLEYPVIRLDLSSVPARTPEIFREALARRFREVAEEYEVELEIPTVEEGLRTLIKVLSKKYRQVVLLVDEYDAPIVDNLSKLDIAEENRNTLRFLFRPLKEIDNCLKFVFVTGVGKIAQTFLFSGFNNLVDLTIREEFADLFGYTEQEIKTYFSEHVQGLVEKLRKKNKKTTELEVYATMKEWYNGYKFCCEGPAVFNPHSTMSFLVTGKPKNYWFSTGTTTFLVEQIKKSSPEITEFSGIVEDEEVLMNISELEDINLNALMWQSGYLSIQTCDESESFYTLDFPNKEVRIAFYRTLVRLFSKGKISTNTDLEDRCRKFLEELDLENFLGVINSLIAKIPSNLFSKQQESLYHALFVCLLEGMGIKTRAEDRTNLGQIDLTVEFSNVIYIFEFKIDQSAKIAFKQILDKKYQDKYLQDGKTLALVGINFSTKSRDISEYKGEAFSPEGKKIISW